MKAVLEIVLGLAYCLLLALPVMWLTAFLHDYGWPIVPLGYWASYLVAFLISWIVDGSGTVRRIVAEVDK